ncbi:MAG: hypothetical protein U1B84_20560 [Variovorax sp.]|nr:hypothetical protein [Variovorax sp.]
MSFLAGPDFLGLHRFEEIGLAHLEIHQCHCHKTECHQTGGRKVLNQFESGLHLKTFESLQ